MQAVIMSHKVRVAMPITNIRFSFGIDKSKPRALLEQVQAALKAQLKDSQVPLRYAVVSVSGRKAVVEASVLDRGGLV
jgi:hypothetical protein